MEFIEFLIIYNNSKYILFLNQINNDSFKKWRSLNSASGDLIG